MMMMVMIIAVSAVREEGRQRQRGEMSNGEKLKNAGTTPIT